MHAVHSCTLGSARSSAILPASHLATRSAILPATTQVRTCPGPSRARQQPTIARSADRRIADWRSRLRDRP
eukprot:15466504-Alexandrium_andersonii.AAC.1